jgi:glycosyltransferase involved in cell wall biosynthesis
MVDRKKVALTYTYDENWIAGSYYVVNIINALNSLPPEKKPELVILHREDRGLELIKEADYPHISFVNTANKQISPLFRLIDRICLKFLGYNFSLKKPLKGVSHIFEGNEKFSFIKHHYYWVHDFQELRLPEFFSREEAQKRSALPTKVAQLKNATLIVSSQDALNDFKTFFPEFVCKVRVWRFASSLPDFSTIDIGTVKKEFKINDRYFLCSNQFWQHKNHMVILEAINILKDRNLEYQVVFTGKNFDHRNPQYFEKLQRYISDKGLEKWTNFVGFIDRKVQLCLGSNAISYIQPSFFEGWSTTVEDAKCLNQYVILSDIPVHKEQMDYNVSFFNPKCAQSLAEAIVNLLTKETVKEVRDYSRNITDYGSDILLTFED